MNRPHPPSNEPAAEKAPLCASDSDSRVKERLRAGDGGTHVKDRFRTGDGGARVNGPLFPQVTAAHASADWTPDRDISHKTIKPGPLPWIARTKNVNYDHAKSLPNSNNASQRITRNA